MKCKSYIPSYGHSGRLRARFLLLTPHGLRKKNLVLGFAQDALTPNYIYKYIYVYAHIGAYVHVDR